MRTAAFHLRLTATQHEQLRKHLYPGDGKEAIALALCGRRNGSDHHILTMRRIVQIPHEQCILRTPLLVKWPTTAADSLLRESYAKRQAIIKIHSHPSGFHAFSETDDSSDLAILSGIATFMDDDLPHASAVMLPDGTLFGRVLLPDGGFKALTKIAVIGDDLVFWFDRRRTAAAEFTLRQAQAFGQGTVDILRSLSVGVVGCSGTGSFVVEQLARLGFRKLTLVDPDCVEEKNLNRIVNAGKEDAYLRRNKTAVLASAIARMGLDQEVVQLPMNLVTPEAVLALAECDVVFGCMDSVEGRHMLNRLCTFYLIPYFDVGVKLDADGKGGIDTIGGSVHYLQPGKSSLLSRGVYSMKQVEAEGIRRTNASMYEQQRREGYLRGVNEDRPAVVSVNAFFSALVVNEFLARLHPYRNQPNSNFATVQGDLTEVRFVSEPERDTCQMLLRHVGRGDLQPLLDRASLS